MRQQLSGTLAAAKDDTDGGVALDVRAVVEIGSHDAVKFGDHLVCVWTQNRRVVLGEPRARLNTGIARHTVVVQVAIAADAPFYMIIEVIGVVGKGEWELDMLIGQRLQSRKSSTTGMA
jgi:hypothetical protein